MIFLFIIKPRVKKIRNTIHDISVYIQTCCKKVRNTIQFDVMIIQFDIIEVRRVCGARSGKGINYTKQTRFSTYISTYISTF